MLKKDNNIKFYGLVTVKTIKELIQHYEKKSNKKVKEILLCMNKMKFINSVEPLRYSIEIDELYDYKYSIKIINIDNVIINMVLSKSIPYNSIESYPIYK